MARKLKTFVTQMGFRDLAVPSMKAALEAWGISQELFHQGFAQQTEALAIVSAATAKPGTVLRRPAGSKKGFSEKAALPRVKGHPTKIKKAVPDLTALREAKQNRDKAEARHARAMEKLHQRQADLEDEIAAEEACWEDERLGLDKAVTNATRS